MLSALGFGSRLPLQGREPRAESRCHIARADAANSVGLRVGSGGSGT